MTYGDPPSTGDYWITTTMDSTRTVPQGAVFPGGSGGVGTYTVTVPDTSTWIQSVPDKPISCIVCDCTLDGASYICELCRRAVLMFREKVLEQMARELFAMGE